MSWNKRNRREFLQLSTGTVLAGTLLFGANRLAYAQTDEMWPQPGYDSANTGHAPTNKGPTSNVEQEWAFADLGPRGAFNEPAVVAGTVYLGTSYGLYALSVDDGSEQWAFGDRTNIEFKSIAISEGTVIAGSDERDSGTVYALSAEDGSEQWSQSIDKGNTSPPTIADGAVYIGSEIGIHTFSIDGQQRWEWSPSFGDFSKPSPAVVNGTVFAGGVNDTAVYALSANDATEQWSQTIGSNDITSPVVDDGTVYVINGNGILFALSSDGGTEEWTFDTLGNGRNPPRIADGTVFVDNGSDRKIYALDSSSGEIQWEFDTEDDITAPPVVANGILYLTDRIGKIYALNADDGTEIWSVQVEGAGYTPPVVANNGLYLGGSEGVFGLIQNVETPTPTSAETPTSTPTPASAVTPSPEPTVTSTINSNTETNTPTETAGENGPGFGIGTTLGGLCGLGYLLKNKVDSNNKR